MHNPSIYVASQSLWETPNRFGEEATGRTISSVSGNWISGHSSLLFQYFLKVKSPWINLFYHVSFSFKKKFDLITLVMNISSNGNDEGREAG